jgi:hypothetical protein
LNLLKPLRDGAGDEALKEIITEAIWWKPWGHKLDEDIIPLNRVMSEIGG